MDKLLSRRAPAPVPRLFGFVALACCLCAICPHAFGAELSAGTDLEIRLAAAVGSHASHVGDRLQAVVIAPVIEDGAVVVPQGALLSGSVVSVHRLGLGLRRCVASIELRFDSLQIVPQRTIPVVTRVLEVETAKERVSSKGVIGGIHPALNLSTGFSVLISAILMQPGAAVPVLGVKFLLVRSPDPEIYFPQGTELIVQLKKDVLLPSEAASTGRLPELSAGDNLRARQQLSRMPEQQSKRGPDYPSDLTNIMLLGTSDAIGRSFHAAGWTRAQAHNAIALYRMFYCVVTRAGYSKAPMARLQLNGVPQQVGYQKTLDTFAKRHHIRLWKQDEPNVWLGAGTEDVSFAVHKMRVTHASDQNIDNERAKIVDDLAMTGCLEAASIVPRNNLQIEAVGTRSIATDGDVAVVKLNDCMHPVNVTGPEHRPMTSHVAHIATVIGLDMLRSNPLSLAVNISHSILNADAGHSSTVQAVARQGRKPLATDALLSNHWKRPSVIANPVSVASGSSSVTGQ